MKWQIMHGKVEDIICEIPSDSFDACFTDPPYGINIDKWDQSIPSIDIWKQIYRVLKDNTCVLTFGHKKTFYILIDYLEKAGFKYRDTIIWMYATGMPHKNNLKPSWEPVILAMKGKTRINIDECKIGEKNRWPGNIIHDGSEEITKLFPYTKSGNWTGQNKGIAFASKNENGKPYYWEGDEGNASRFFVARYNMRLFDLSKVKVLWRDPLTNVLYGLSRKVRKNEVLNNTAKRERCFWAKIENESYFKKVPLGPGEWIEI